MTSSSAERTGPDRVLLAARAGHTGGVGLSELVALDEHRLRRAAYLLVGDPVAADRLVRAAYVGLSRRRRLLRDPYAARRWLARSVALGARRRPASRPGAGRPDPVREALDRLPPREREVLILGHLLGLGLDQATEELGDVLGEPPAVVRSRRERGLLALRAQVGLGPDDEAGLPRGLAERLDRWGGEVSALDPSARARLVDELDASDRRRRRVRRVVLALAPVVVGAAALAWAPWAHRPDRTPPGPERVPTAAERVADEFVTSYLSFDRAGAARLVAPGADLDMTNFLAGPGWWVRLNRFNEATGFRAVARAPCRQLEEGRAGTVVLCPYWYDQFGAGRLGLGPFGDTVFEVVVVDGLVANGDIITSTTLNPFFTQVEDRVHAWLADTHAGDAALLDAWRSDEASPDLVRRSLRLWHLRAAEYVAAMADAQER